MSISNLKETGMRLVFTGVHAVKKYSPELLTAGAVVGVVGTAVLASRASIKSGPILKDLREDILHIRSSDLTEVELRRAISKRYADGYFDIFKTFVPTITTGAATVVCVLSAHGILKRRNVAMAAAYKVLETSFKEYRERVTEEVGEEREHDIRHGIKTVEVVDEATGKKKKVKTLPKSSASPYARLFDETNGNWQATPDYNDLFLRNQQRYANDMLRVRKIVTLNDVYDSLGFDRTSEGQLVGWVYGGNGDNFIDFGLDKFEWKDQNVWVGPQALLLDFNVDGFILDDLK